MRVLGVDSSLSCTGLALIGDGAVRTKRLPTSTTSTLRGTDERIRYIVGQMLQFAGRPTLAVIEAPYVPKGDKAAGSVIERAWLYGFLVDQLLQRCEVVAVAAPTRALYAAENGRASKAEVRAAMRARHPGVAIPDDNVADALALAAMGARWAGAPIDGDASKKQEQAMRTVRWPNTERN